MKPTQEQILSALNKLIRENKTELKTEKVELGAIDDFTKAFEKALNEPAADKLITDLRKAEVGFEKAIPELNLNIDLTYFKTKYSKNSKEYIPFISESVLLNLSNIFLKPVFLPISA